VKFVLSDRIELLRRLNSERSRDLGPWEFEPAKNSGYITTIFGRYKSGEPAGLAYTVSGDADQQNVDAEFICAMTNAADDLFAERAAMMSRIGKYREALGAIELALDEFADEGTPGYQPLSDGERMALEARRIVKKVLREPDCPTPEAERDDTINKGVK
jgi:hypothetical protein